MPRKRKQAIQEEQSDNGEDESTGKRNSSVHHGPMYTIMSNAQLNETFHNKYIKEMQQLYLKMDHDAFMYTFIRMIKSAMEPDETNEYAQNTLLFCAKFISSYNGDDTHPVLDSIFHWLLSTTSNNAHIRYRLCQFVNLVLNSLGLEAALDDSICDNIMTYMVNRLQDLHPNIRVQAILALQRLQIPDNPDDIVIKTYQFHLSADPSPRVRMAVITSMGRNYNTIPYILERLWDNDEKVRRHTYFQMSTFSAKAYKVSQRLTFLEQGLNDRSDMVRKVVTTVMLPQWLESYAKNIIAFISSLKLDANEAEMDRFRKITKVALREVFKREKVDQLIENLPIVQDDGEFKRCIPLDELSVENTLYWLCLIEYLQNEAADEVDLIIPELTVFCQYVQKYCESAKLEMDKWEKMEYQYILLTLMEIIYTFDLGDEIGRENLKQLLMKLLKNFEIESHTVEIIIRIGENLMCEQEERLQYFVDIINDILNQKTWQPNNFSHDRSLIDELLEKQPDKSLKLKLSSLKVKILDLEEQERIFVEKKDYAKAQEIAEEKNVCNDEYSNLLQPILDQISSNFSNESTRKSLSSSLRQAKKVTTDMIIKCLQIAFHMVVSKKVKSLTPIVCELYREFIRRHIASNQISIRDWALKCGTAYSMLYDQLSKDVYVELYSQFYKNHNTRIWKVSIDCIFELIDKYGLAHFELEDKQNKSRKPGRQLYNSLEFFDGEEDVSSSYGQGVDLVFMMSHFLDTCDDVGILVALVNGFCRLILHGRIENNGIVEKLVLKYFNPVIDPEINQILGVFFENLISKKKQDYLQSCLLPTISTIMSVPYEDPLHEIKPETVIRFVVQSTQPMYCRQGVNIHNKIADSFLQEMQSRITNKELIKILAKEIVTLEISVHDDNELKMDFIKRCENLLQADLDIKVTKYLNIFKEILEGNSVNRVRSTNERASDDENYDLSAEEDENRNTALEQNKENTAGNGDEQPHEQNQSTIEPEKETNVVEELQNDKNVESESENSPLVTNTEKKDDSSVVEKRDDAANTKETGNSEEFLTEKSKNPESLDALEKPNSYDVGNAEKSNTSVADDNLEKTPTTFGRDNTTAIRYLRKSLNAKRSATDIGTSRPQKRRILNYGSPLVNGISIDQKKTDHKKDVHNKSMNNLDPTEQKLNSKQNKNNLKSKKIFDTVPNTPPGVLSTSYINDDSITIPETQGSPLPLSNKEIGNLQKPQEQRSDDESVTQNVRPTTETNTKRQNKINIEIPESISSRRSNRLTSKSVQLPAKNSRITNKSDVRSRQLSFSALPESDRTESDSKDTKEENKVGRPLKARSSNEKTPEKEISVINSSDKRKRNMEPPSNYILTKSTEKRIVASKHPIVRIPRFNTNANGMTTRSAKKKENAFNTVLTRRQRSLDKIPVGLESAIILSPKKNIPSNQTTPLKSKESRGEKVKSNQLTRNIENVKSKTNSKQLEKNTKSTTTLEHSSRARRKL